MKSLRARILASVLLVSAVVLTGWLRGDPEQQVDAERIGLLIGQLGHHEYAVRESAGAQLYEFGETALPFLQDAANRATDAEIRWRALDVLRAILHFSKSTRLELVVIEPGEFSMGSPADEKGRRDDELPHRVRIGKRFLLGKYEVTQQEFEQVMETKPSWFSKAGGGKGKVAGEDTRRLPVEMVTWFDAIDFCNRLSALDGFSPYYKLTWEKREGKSIKSASIAIVGGSGYRLPTEAEWEYACRAGSTSAFQFGAENTGHEANIKPASVAGGYGAVAKWRELARTTTIGTYPPNRWGLCDMHGNVGEWCFDRYDQGFYAASPADDPAGPDEGNHRVLRGGSWLVLEENCRSASRFWQTPDERKEYAGFRVARTP